MDNPPLQFNDNMLGALTIDTAAEASQSAQITTVNLSALMRIVSQWTTRH